MHADNGTDSSASANVDYNKSWRTVLISSRCETGKLNSFCSGCSMIFCPTPMPSLAVADARQASFFLRLMLSVIVSILYVIACIVDARLVRSFCDSCSVLLCRTYMSSVAVPDVRRVSSFLRLILNVILSNFYVVGCRQLT